MNRREFLGLAGLGSLTAMVPHLPHNPGLERIGLQLYTLRQREKAGLQHYFVEHDHPPDPIASVRASYAHLQKLSRE